MAAFSVSDVPIEAWGWRAALVVVVAGLLVASWRPLRSRWARWSARALCLPLVLAFAGLTVNAHYDYFPTLGSLLGRTAADRVSSAAFRRLEQAYVHGMHKVYGTIARSRHAGGASGSHLPSHGFVVAFAMPGLVSHFPARTGQVYLPPVWFQDPRPQLPVVELLHGSPGSPADWTRAGFVDLTADTYARAHHGFAPILVMPDSNGGTWFGDTECVDGPRGLAETYLTVDVRRAVVHAFGADPSGRAWAVAGLSAGGSCALQMGLRHPGLFAAVGDFSGDDHPWVPGGLRALFFGRTPAQLERSEAAYDPRRLLAGRRPDAGPAPAIFFVSGHSDGLVFKIDDLYREARRDHIDAVFETFDGAHRFAVWARSFYAALPWFVAHLDTRSPASGRG